MERERHSGAIDISEGARRAWFSRSTQLDRGWSQQLFLKPVLLLGGVDWKSSYQVITRRKTLSLLLQPPSLPLSAHYWQGQAGSQEARHTIKGTLQSPDPG